MLDREKENNNIKKPGGNESDQHINKLNKKYLQDSKGKRTKSTLKFGEI